MTSDIQTQAQIAALPVKGKPGKYRVLLVTSRETRRWIIPKGWPMKQIKDHVAAAIEAKEEAGVTGRVHKHPMGTYTYDKRLADEQIVSVRVDVYMLEVDQENEKWREKSQRSREWVSTKEAARRVQEPELVAIIKRLDIAAVDARD